ncbi:hypothetical protein [Actinophytocola sp.]|uniref:hypothetical protein n=1 Tax=Actinophytocola sp. TaxID=1872138 RepID=UPI002ED38C21
MRRLRSVLAVVLIGGLLSTACTSSKPANVPGQPVQDGQYVEISYAGASAGLAGLDESEAAEQIRDWARFGLASHLEMDTARLRDAFYDTFPVRDAAFGDIARQPVGAGRSVFDGRGVLHILVPHDDQFRARSIGTELDQYRTDAGADPQRVQVHEYRIDRATQTIGLWAGREETAAKVRADNGYFIARVDQLDGLTDFLARSRRLSWVRTRGSETWAGGWSWPDGAGARLDVEDVWAVQRGYEDPSDGLPGFSLDPVVTRSEEDLAAALPDVSPELVSGISTGDWAGSGYASEQDLLLDIDKALDDESEGESRPTSGLPADRSQLWSMRLALRGGPVFSTARYDGWLAGTAVGMTLFYTDFVAKSWLTGVGRGVPPATVGGFAANTRSPTPPAFCDKATEANESTRLWFGQRDTGFRFTDEQVSLGARATQLFSVSTSGTEAESSYLMSRGLRWWDQHYEVIGDYEPQYRRLEEIMRWSGALEWLVMRAGANLPRPDHDRVTATHRFDDWYANNELRETEPIAFVTSPSVEHEAVRTAPSAFFVDCGEPWLVGGVSLADSLNRRGDRTLRADLPDSVARAGAFDEGSAFDPASGTGHIVQGSVDEARAFGNLVDRTLSRTEDGHAVTDVVAPKSRNASFGALKDLTGANGPRELRNELHAENGTLHQAFAYQGEPVGELVSTKTSRTQVLLWWARGSMSRVRAVLESIQKGKSGRPEPRDVLLAVELADGRMLYRTGERWLSTDVVDSSAGGPAFRYGYVDPTTSKPVLGNGKLVPPPSPVAPWMSVPAAGGGLPVVRPANPPGTHATRITVTMADGEHSALFVDGDTAVVPSDDRYLGINGTVPGAALLRTFDSAVAPVLADLRESADSFYRGVLLGPDGAVLIGRDNLVLFGSGDPVYALVAHAQSVHSGRSPPIFELEGGRFEHIAKISDSARVEARENDVNLADLLADDGSGAQVYMHRDMARSMPVDNGVVVPEKIPRDRKVNVVTIRSETGPRVPAIVHYRGALWHRIGPGPTGTGTPPAGGGSGGGPGGGDGSGAGRGGGGPIIRLVCPVDTAEDEQEEQDEYQGCGQ